MNNKKLYKGEKAPKFVGKAIDGSEVLPFQSRKWKFLSFHRFAACPFCVLRTNELIKMSQELNNNNIEIISIWPSNIANMKNYVGNQLAPFPLLSDIKMSIYKAYGVTKSSKKSKWRLFFNPKLVKRAMEYKYDNPEIDGDSSLLPAEFLIDPKGNIAIAYYGKHYGDHIKIEKLISHVVNYSF